MEGIDPTKRPPYPTPRRADILVRADGVFLVNGLPWGNHRVGAAMLNYARYCRCKVCTSCQVGRVAMETIREELD